MTGNIVFDVDVSDINLTNLILHFQMFSELTISDVTPLRKDGL